MSQIQAFTKMGMQPPFTPYRGYHFGGKSFKKRNGDWVPDRQPGSSETKEMQARRRAKKKAYMNEVGLHAPPVTARSWMALEQTVKNVLIEQEHEAEEEQRTQNYTTRKLVRDEDGDIIFAPENGGKPTDGEIVDGEYIEMEADALDDITVADAEPIADDGRPLDAEPAGNGKATAEEAAIIAEWTSPQSAQKWIAENGLATNGNSARVAFKGIVDKHFGGSLKKPDVQEAYLLYLRERVAKHGEAVPA